MRFLSAVHTMPDGAVENLVNLEELWLFKCQIDELSSGSLKGLGNLQILDLRLNVLLNISDGAFEHTPKLKDLRILGNYLLPDGETFRGLGELEVRLMLLKNVSPVDLRNFSILFFALLCSRALESLLCRIKQSVHNGFSQITFRTLSLPLQND